MHKFLGRYSFANNVTILGNCKISSKFICKGKLIDLVELHTKTWKKSKFVEIAHKIDFTSTQIQVKDLIVEGINDVDIHEWIDDAVFADGNYNITGKKIFKKLSKFTKLSVVSLNSIVFSKFLANAVSFGNMQTILSNVSFLGNVKFLHHFTVMGNMSVRGTMGGYKFPDILKDAVYIDRDMSLTGTVTFLKSVQVNSKVKYIGLVNNIDLYNDVVLYNGNQTISGNKVFGSVACGDVMVETSVNGYNLKRMRESTLMKYGNQTIHSHRQIKVGQFLQIT